MNTSSSFPTLTSPLGIRLQGVYKIKMGRVVTLIGSGIGLASEALAHRKQTKAKATNASSTSAAHETRSGVPTLIQPSATTQYASQQADTVKLSDEKAAELVSTGQAVPVGYSENDEPTDAPPSYDEVVNDEEDWALDEAGDKGHGGRSPALAESQAFGNEKPDVRKILGKFLERHAVIHGQNQNVGRLPCTVIIPQRRPRTKSRGFVKAYAPVLEHCGINQATWMDFLGTFHEASQASPVFSGILIAGHFVGFVPSPSAMVASMLMQAGATIALGLHSRSRTNTFLDEINEHFFRPLGLFVLLIKYKGSRDRWSSEPLDISHAIATSSQTADAPKSGNRAAKFKHNLQFGSGTSHGVMEIPESAPLIFPALDNAAAEAEAASAPAHSGSEDPKGKFTSTLKKSSNFVNDYLDRRAQATFRSENPLSAPLHTPSAGDTSKFASRYSDPTHPASSGSLVALLTGGAVDPKGSRQRRDQQLRASRGIVGPMGYVKKNRPVRRMMQQEVLYLMVMNMPSGEEIVAAKNEMEGKGERVEGGEEEEGGV